MGIECQVVAYSRNLRHQRDQVKASRGDAIGLARLSRAGKNITVRVPDDSHGLAMGCMSVLRRAGLAVVQAPTCSKCDLHIDPCQKRSGPGIGLAQPGRERFVGDSRVGDATVLPLC